MRQPATRQLSDNDKRILRLLLERYAARYHLAGPQRDQLVEAGFATLLSNPAKLLDKPVEQVVAETVDRLSSKA